MSSVNVRSKRQLTSGGRLRGSIHIRRAGRAALDLGASGLSFLLALLLSLQLGWSGALEGRSLLGAVLAFIGVCAFVYRVTGLSRRSWRFVALRDLFLLVRDILIAVSAFVALTLVTTPLRPFANSIPLIAGFIMISMLTGLRVIYRFLVEHGLSLEDRRLRHRSLANVKLSHILVYGASEETDVFLRALQSKTEKYVAVGIIDDEKLHRDRSIRGIDVLGGITDLPRILESFAVSGVEVETLVLPAMDLPRPKLLEIVDASAAARLKVARLQNGCDLSVGKRDLLDFEPIHVTDLLCRAQVSLRMDSVDTLIRGKSVVVTGGGGSIGSELCRHLLDRGPSQLVIVDHNELSLFQIERELAKIDCNGVVKPVLASIRDRDKIQTLLSEARVDYVFHAAAYKHVPLVEANPIEGILTNFVGTANVADAAAAVGAIAMIMVSTDKAVKPSSVMGLSKRAAEAYCQAMDLQCATQSSRTRFIVVRFGNVLGSSGSVVPIFEQQIRNGGPVTVTDPRMTRYFMTIMEAVNLVLQAAAFEVDRATGRGAILVLDMGEPVPIIELARRMIELAGLLPDRDIPIKFLGIRDGEKLHEALFDDDESLETTDAAGIRLARSKVHDLRQLRELRNGISAIAPSGDAEAIIALIREVVLNDFAHGFCNLVKHSGWRSMHHTVESQTDGITH